MKPVRQVLEEHAEELMGLPGVVGLAESERDGLPCILVMAASRTAELERRLPERLDGYPVELRITGDLRPRGS